MKKQAYNLKKNNEGITLIALIATVIILVILAGAAIWFLIGDNGILNKTSDAVITHREGTAEEDIEMAWGSCEADYWRAWARTSTVKKIDYFGENLGNYTELGVVSDFKFVDKGVSTGRFVSYDGNIDDTFIVDRKGKVYFGKILVFDANGGRFYNGSTEPVIIAIEADERIEEKMPKDPNKQDWTFVGWYDENGTEIKEDTVITGPLKISAHWGYSAKNIASADYGKTVNYGKSYADTSNDGKNEWEILYADSSNIYLITRGFVKADTLGTNYNENAYTGTSDFSDLSSFPAVSAGWLNKIYNPKASGTTQDPMLKYTSDKANMKATEYLLDSRRWKIYANEYADWVIGGPTLEMFVESYNQTKPAVVDILALSENGYSKAIIPSGINQGSYLNPNNERNGKNSYWLASPSSDYYGNFVNIVYGSSSSLDSSNYTTANSFRPVVCLKNDVVLRWNEQTDSYDFVTK